jgi:thiosulfate dehydrogenase
LFGATHLDRALGFQPEDKAAGEIEVGEVFLVSLGGKLYDDLWLVLDQAPPAGSNPEFPATKLYSSRDSWRCVSCHGWDYSGVTIDGRQFPSLQHLRGVDPFVIVEYLQDPKHPFPVEQIGSLTLTLLGAFLSEGQYDRDRFFNSQGHALGDAEQGQAIFEGACINCHQIDGRRYIRGEIGDKSSLGWVARNRPAQSLHKILNGVPGAEMLSLRFLADSQVADLVAYLQSLDPNER